MKTVVILGMHRSGTSLVSSILHTLGVTMCPSKALCGGKSKSQPHGYWEDIAFVQLNKAILRSAGGYWNIPPDPAAVRQAGTGFESTIKALVRQRGRELWGYKDPRSCLTQAALHPHLTNPYYILTERDPEAIVASLHRRNGYDRDFTIDLINHYLGQRLAFINAHNPPHLPVVFEELVGRGARAQIKRIIRFLDLSVDNIQPALARIRRD